MAGTDADDPDSDDDLMLDGDELFAGTDPLDCRQLNRIPLSSCRSLSRTQIAVRTRSPAVMPRSVRTASYWWRARAWPAGSSDASSARSSSRQSGSE